MALLLVGGFVGLATCCGISCFVTLGLLFTCDLDCCWLVSWFALRWILVLRVAGCWVLLLVWVWFCWLGIGGLSLWFGLLCDLLGLVWADCCVVIGLVVWWLVFNAGVLGGGRAVWGVVMSASGWFVLRCWWCCFGLIVEFDGLLFFVVAGLCRIAWVYCLGV